MQREFYEIFQASKWESNLYAHIVVAASMMMKLVAKAAGDDNNDYGDDDESTQIQRFILSTRITNTHMQINKTTDMTENNPQRIQ